MNVQNLPQVPVVERVDINELHKKFQEYGKNVRAWIRKCKMLLPQIRDEEVWRKKGFGSIYEYAAKLAGMSRASVDDALWIMDKIQDKPNLQKVAEKKGLNCVRPVANIVTNETDTFWAEKAQKMSRHTLATYVREHKSEHCDPQELEDGCSFEKSRTGPSQKVRTMKSIYMKLDVKTIERMKKMKGEKEWDELLNKMLDVVEGLECGGGHEGQKVIDEGGDGTGEREVAQESGVDTQVDRNKEVTKKPKPVNTGRRHVPAKIKKYVTKQTSGLCAYPGCVKPYDILHHTKRFAIDPTHDPETLKPLCKAHERLAHAGLIESEEEEPVVDDGGEFKVNWSVRKQADMSHPKRRVDEVVNQYYMRE